MNRISLGVEDALWPGKRVSACGPFSAKTWAKHLRNGLILVDRFWDLYTQYWPSHFLVKLTVEKLVKYKAQPKYVSDDARTWKQPSRAWDIGRVRFFYEELLAGKTVDPIMIDNVCEGGNVEPSLLDGHHRLVASRLARVPTIPADYSGRVDLLNYLTGKRKTCPAS